jgi:hypothetical protein
MLSQLASKLSNFTTTSVRLEPVSGRTLIEEGGYVEFHLPSESIVNLNSFALSFKAEVESGTVGPLACRLPAGIEGLVEDVSVWCGGVCLDSQSQWFGKRRALKDRVLGVRGDAASHPVIQRMFDRTEAYGTMGELEPTHRYTTRRLTEGFLGAGMIDTSLMPQITVRIQFTTKGVLGISNGTTFSAFATSTTLIKEAFHFKTLDHYAVVEIVSAGAAYDAMQERIMSTVGYIPVPFKRVHCFQGGMNEGDVRFNIATRSLDRVYFCTDGGEASAGAPYLANKPAVSATAIDSTERGLDHEIYDASRFRSIAANMDGTAYMSIAGARVPAFDASVHDWYSITRNALPKPDENDV